MEYGYLNIGSIICGMVAVVIPIINLLKENKKNNNKWCILSLISISACAISLCMQIVYASYLVSINDFTALMDTFPTITFVAIALLMVTITLNIIVYAIYSKFEN